MDTTATPAETAANTGADEATAILADLGVNAPTPATDTPVPAAEAKPDEPKAEEAPPRNKAEKALGAKFAEAHRIAKEAKAKITEAEAVKATIAAREAEIAKREERVTAFEKALASRDIDNVLGTLEAAGVTFEAIIDHLASKGKALTPEEKAQKETAERLARLEAEREQERKDAEARKKAEEEAAAKATAAERQRLLDAHVSTTQQIAKAAGYEVLPRQAAQRAIDIVHEHWMELGRPAVSETDYADAIRAALGRVEEEFEAEGMLLKKTPKVATPPNVASGSEPASTPLPQPVANTAAPKTITSSTVSGTPIAKPVAASLNHEDALAYAFSTHGL